MDTADHNPRHKHIIIQIQKLKTRSLWSVSLKMRQYQLTFASCIMDVHSVTVNRLLQHKKAGLFAQHVLLKKQNIQTLCIKLKVFLRNSFDLTLCVGSEETRYHMFKKN